MTVNRARTSSAIVGAVALALVAGCSASGSPSGEPDEAAALSVVASTNVWGDIVAQVGGDLVEVTSIISDPSADPHSYEANARTQLAISEASLVVANGGGYDDFVDTMVAALDAPPPMLHAYDVAATGEENEHVWYSLRSVRAVADEIATQLSTLAPDDAATFTANAEAFDARLADLENQVAALADDVQGTPVAITEPVPGYLLQDAGLEDLTPVDFSEAIEEETDVPPAVMAQTLALFTDHAVKALVYNEQTTGPQTEEVLAAAEAADVAVVPVRETLPADTGYVDWMTANIAALREALQG